MKPTYLMCALLTISGLVACSEPAEKAKETVTPKVATQEAEDTQSTKGYVPNPAWETLKVGAEVSYEPFEFQNKNGLATGFEIELLQEIGKAEEFNVSIFDTPRKDIIKSFDKHGYAIWASALSRKPKREAIMDLSDTVISTEIGAFVLDNEKNKDIVDPEGLKDKTFAVSKGASDSTLDEIAELSGSKDNAVFADSFFLALTKVYNGQADAILADERIADYYMQQFPEQKLKKISLGKGEVEIAFAVKKGDTQTLEKVNSGLAKVKADGTYDKLVKKWFGDIS